MKFFRKRARDLGIKIGEFKPGPLNAITDVSGVKVGQVTKIEGEGKLIPGRGPVRTGVTAVLPHSGDIRQQKVPAGGFIFNGCGELCGLAWVNESGALEVPVLLTNTHCVGRVADSVISYLQEKYPEIGVDDDTVTPVVGECDDSTLNDIRGRHITEADVREAIEGASGGEVAEGAVGAGTGMICYGLKGGIGTSSRVLSPESGGYTVGVLVLANFGDLQELMINGVPVGKELKLPEGPAKSSQGSVVVIIATDAPLVNRQLIRLCKRALMGIARTGTCGYHGSGDFFLAFSNGFFIPHEQEELTFSMEVVGDNHLDPLFQAAAEAAREAVINTLCMAETVEGRDGNTAHALPLDQLKEIMQR